MMNLDPSRFTKPIHIIVFGLLTLLSASACNSVGENAADNQVTAWSVILSYSGGFAGIRRSIALDHTGLAVFRDEKLKTKTEKMLEPDHLQVFADLVKILPGREAADTRSKQCRDCINYSLVVVYDGLSKRRMTDDLALQTSDARELISKLKVLASELGKEK